VLASPWLLISTTVVAWAWLNPEATVLFFFVIPMKAKWIGWLDIALLYFMFPPHIGALQFILGFFALGGVAVAYGYTRYRQVWGWIPRRPKEPATRRSLRHPAANPFQALLRPFREWQRRRRIAYLKRTFHLDDDDKR
jgi:hypothetical protein